jgi:hypothetical protein
MHSKLMFALTLSAALAAPLALAGKAFAADQTLGMAIMSAAVKPDGSLAYGAGAVESVRTATNSYHVKFNRHLGGCVSSITPFNDGIIASGGYLDQAGGVQFVVLRTDAGAPYAGAFQLIVFCPN